MKLVLTRIAQIILVAILLTMVFGCTTIERTVTVEVPVPVACTQQEPAKPDLAIDTMSPDAPLDYQVRQMRADHDARDGYEIELRAALRACRTIGAK